MEQLTLPLLPLRDRIIFPEVTTYFEVSRQPSLKALEETINHYQRIFLVSQMDPEVDKPKEEDIYSVGTVAVIIQMVKAGNNTLRVFVEGKTRARMVSYMDQGEYVLASLETIDDSNTLSWEEETADIRILDDSLADYVERNPGSMTPALEKALAREELIPLLYEIAYALPISLNRKQALLEETDVRKQAEELMKILAQESEISGIRNRIAKKVKVNVDKNQRDFILREQQKVIREELGEEDAESEADEYLEKLDKLKASKEVKNKIRKEIRRFRNIPPVAAEHTVMKNYIETMLEMPWNKASRDNKDLKKAMTILEEDHYGLSKVKERILDYLAVRTLNKKSDAPILCLVGPPGTGKTSIAKSIARALDKKYVRISLGGVRDEAEIRGHRKTYVGAMPGRIAEGIRHAGVRNPVMLLDEVDKVSSDYKGDTASALLEVLDGEQNSHFRDHFLEVPLDLSDVLFIATANDLSPIARPLLDRMEVIELSSYTENEKFHIAKNYLIKKQRKASGIQKKQITFPDEIILEIIHSYTREAGVRNLERRIGQIMHKVARKILEGETHYEVKKDSLEELLGTAPYEEDDFVTGPQVGIVRGLAWTSVGGDTLSIEVSVMPGKGNLELTGQMGSVMRESAQIGLSYVRSVSEKYQIPEDYFEKHDIHLHIPEGAGPKDGPSAGITMALAMLSGITGIPVRGDIAMTGEITLRGRVLPVGGLKEKLLAAKTAGVKEVLLPERNRRSLREIEEEILEGMTITYVNNMDEVTEHSLVYKNE